MSRQTILRFALLFIVAMWMSLPARGEPILQLYLEGGTYDPVSESWYLQPPGSSAGQAFRLWAIGNVAAKGTIEDVKLAVAYGAEYRTAERDILVELIPSLVGGTGEYSGVSDDSIPETPEWVQYGEEGSVPELADGTSLPSHGEYGPGIVWQEFFLGDFTEPGDSPLGDFTGAFPTSFKANAAQINAYEVSVRFTDGSSAHGVRVHFDLYNHVMAGNHAKYKFAPFSHDADGTGDIVPEPGTWAAVSGMIIVGACVWYRRRKRGAV
ncbi:hypothetical protein JCM19992_17860 [Thermostilla marina]